MKKKLLYFSILALGVLFVACDENEVMPSSRKVGTATHTMASIALSNTTPLTSESITVQLSYVNPSSDPLKEISIRAKVGAADFVEIQKFDMTSEEHDEIAMRNFNYTAPATVATTVVFDMVITSQREFPQVKRTELKTK